MPIQASPEAQQAILQARQKRREALKKAMRTNAEVFIKIGKRHGIKLPATKLTQSQNATAIIRDTARLVKD